MTTISEIVPGEKFQMFNQFDKLDKKVYKLRAILKCDEYDKLHISVNTDPFWFWCIHIDTEVERSN